MQKWPGGKQRSMDNDQPFHETYILPKEKQQMPYILGQR